MQVAGKLELDEAPFDLWSMVEDVMCLLASQAHMKGLHTELIVDSSVPRFVEGDAGPGIPNAAIARIFEPFEQLDNSTARCSSPIRVRYPS